MLDRDLKEREQATLLLGIFAATLGYFVPIPKPMISLSAETQQFRVCSPVVAE
jgi:hypothetical protein